MDDQNQVDRQVSKFKRRGYETPAARRTYLRETSTKYLVLTILPVFLVVVIRMLLSKPVLMVAFLGCGVAVGVASMLTYYTLLSTIVRVVIAGDAVAVDDAWSAGKPTPVTNRSWYRAIDVRGSADNFSATIGLDTYQFERSEWPDFDNLRARLEASLENQKSTDRQNTR